MAPLMRFTGGLPETKCGAGSTLKCTKHLRDELPPLLRSLGVGSLLDAPCGDCNWIAHTDLSGIDYVGVDVDEEMLWLALSKQPKLAPMSRKLIKADLLATGTLPTTDAVMCRDFLQHLPNVLALHVLKRLMLAGCRWLLATSHEAEMNSNIATVGDFRPLNLLLPPISLPPPTKVISDPPGSGRYLGVWEICPT